MGMALEYPFKVLLFIAVILILITIMWNFRDKIQNLCLFDCDDDEKCDVKTVPSSEEYVDQDLINKYCEICWNKNKKGGCTENVLCYAVHSEYGLDTEEDRLLDYCEHSCSNMNAKTIFFQYDSLRKRVFITC